MWECKYGKEPVDYKLAWLRLKKKIWIFPLAMIIGAVLVAGCHYLGKMIEKGGRTYETTSVFYLDFAENSAGAEYEFINYYTWSELIHSDFFMDNLYDSLNGKYSREKLVNSVSATIESDVRYVYVRCTTNSPEESLEMAAALEPIVVSFASEQKEFDEIKLTDRGDTYRDSTKLRLTNALVLGAVLGLVVCLIAVCLVTVLDTRLDIPATIERRYGLKTFGAECMSEYFVNLDLMLANSDRVTYISIDSGENVPDFGEHKVTVIKDFLENTDSVNCVKESDAVVLGVDAGRKNDKLFERYVEELTRFDISITGVVLCNADDKLIKAYYKD